MTLAFTRKLANVHTLFFAAISDLLVLNALLAYNGLQTPTGIIDIYICMNILFAIYAFGFSSGSF